MVSKKVEVLTETPKFQLKCDADYQFSQVLTFNWIYNGTFIHPSLNPGLSVLTNGDLSFDKVLATHAGKRKENISFPYKIKREIM